MKGQPKEVFLFILIVTSLLLLTISQVKDLDLSLIISTLFIMIALLPIIENEISFYGNFLKALVKLVAGLITALKHIQVTFFSFTQIKFRRFT